MRTGRLEILLIGCIAVAAVALLVAWERFRRLAFAFPENRGALFPLVTTSASFLFFAVTLSFPQLLGRDYSTRRYIIIGVNFGLVAVSSIISVYTKGPLRWLLVISGLALTLMWFTIGAVSSAG